MRIPRKDTADIVRLCFDNVSQLLCDARLIHSMKPKIDHAIALIQFAIEELGKASVLQHALDQTQEDIEIENEIFAKTFGGGGKKSHEFKSDEAWKNLDSRLKVLVDGYFDSSYFDSSYFDTDVKLDPEKRLQCLYVDYRDGKIRFYDERDSRKLDSIIEGLESEVKRLRKTWIGTD